MNLFFSYITGEHIIPSLEDYVFVFTGDDLANPTPEQVTFAFDVSEGLGSELNALIDVLSLRERTESVKFKILKEGHTIEFQGQPTLYRMSASQENIAEVVVSL